MGLFAQTTKDARTASTKEKPKKAMEYEYKLTPEDSILVNQLILDPPVLPQPLFNIHGNEQIILQLNIREFYLDKPKEY